ncbi:DUF3575 domain-containing protein [Sungkyunkwania multivorans]|uniref:DUF3575 domain-containing protein n=1 Tax=Sungkyunkwania multivorans TaxID=1173618 RepID=A0ABW3D3N7_9FLAO
MKHYFTILAFVLSFSAFAQQTENSSDLFKRHELRLNTLYAPFGAVNVDYEYLLAEKSGLGVRGNFSFRKDDEFNWSLSAYYRRYFFSKKPGSGFYIEGFAQGTEYGFQNFRSPTTTTAYNLGFGVGLGYKVLIDDKWTIEAGIGLGKNLFDTGDNKEIARAVIGIGYRF